MNRFILSAFGDEIDPNIQTQMDVLEQHDIHYLELRKINGRGIEKYSIPEAKEIKHQLEQHGFKVSALGSPIGKIGITEDFAPHLELFHHVLDIAEVLETKYIRMFSFFIPAGDDPGMYRDEVMRRWVAFINAAQDRGVVLLHENEKEIYGDTPERCLDLLRTMNCEYFKAVFDPANFVQCDVEVFPYAFRLLQDYIAYIHIKDARRDNHAVVPSGEGDGRIEDLLTELSRIGYQGFLSLEPHLALFEGFAELERNAAQQLTQGDNPEKFALAAQALKTILDKVQ